MKIHFLGTNGWYDTDTGNTLCVLIETSKAYIVFDAGNGIYKLDRYIKGKKPVYLFLSHYHLDHVAGLHILVKFKFLGGLKIYGPPGLEALFNNVITSAHTVPYAKLKMPTTIHEFGGCVKPPLKMSYLPLLHSVLCYGYRFNLDGRTVSICTDTGPCENILRLGSGADVLITECTFKPGEVDHAWPHLNPETAAQLARDAAAKKLVLTHFDADRYRTHKERTASGAVAKKIFKNTIVAKDGMSIKI